LAKNYDLVIIGGGIGGYTAAIRASQLGLKTAIVEKNLLGGTCLHQGCIPTKALLRSAEVYTLTKDKAESFGVLTGEVKLDFEKVQQRKKSIVEQLYHGVQGLMKKGKIDVYEGIGRILGPSIFSPIPGTISVELGNGLENEMLLPKSIIIATGSRPRTLNGLELDGELVCSSEELLKLNTLPKSIVIVGGGVIGIEWASMLNDFGIEVTILEYAPSILPMEDEDISKELKRQLTDKGIRIVTSAKVLADQVTIEGTVSVTALVEGEEQVFQAEKMLISVGRQANVENIGI
jgi:dihydrolipoamide dehydrogenase